MIVDPLTKGMPPFKFKDHVERMGLGSTLWLYTYKLKLKLLYCNIFSYSSTLIYLRKIMFWTKNKHWVYSLSFITTLSILLRKLRIMICDICISGCDFLGLSKEFCVLTWAKPFIDQSHYFRWLLMPLISLMHRYDSTIYFNNPSDSFL